MTTVAIGQPAAMAWSFRRLGLVDEVVGGISDPTGLTHLGARDYDPGTGRFTTTDPVLVPADPQALNPYAYAANNPTTFADPSGLCPPDKCGDGMPKGGSDDIVNYGHSDSGWVKDDKPVPSPPEDTDVPVRVGNVIVVARNWNTYTRAYQALQQRFVAKYGREANGYCTSVGAFTSPGGNETCGGSEALILMNFAAQMCQQPGIDCGGQTIHPLAGVLADAAAGVCSSADAATAASPEPAPADLHSMASIRRSVSRTDRLLRTYGMSTSTLRPKVLLRT